MPIREYEREDGTRFERLEGLYEERLRVCPSSGQRLKALPSVAWPRTPDYLKPEAETFNRRHRAWLEKDETQAKIKRGELVPDPEANQGS